MIHARNIFLTAKAIQADITNELGPPEEGPRSIKQSVLPFSVVRDTRGYIERVVNQINGVRMRMVGTTRARV